MDCKLYNHASPDLNNYTNICTKKIPGIGRMSKLIVYNYLEHHSDGVLSSFILYIRLPT